MFLVDLRNHQQFDDADYLIDYELTLLDLNDGRRPIAPIAPMTIWQLRCYYDSRKSDTFLAKMIYRRLWTISCSGSQWQGLARSMVTTMRDDGPDDAWAVKATVDDDRRLIETDLVYGGDECGWGWRRRMASVWIQPIWYEVDDGLGEDYDIVVLMRRRTSFVRWGRWELTLAPNIEYHTNCNASELENCSDNVVRREGFLDVRIVVEYTSQSSCSKHTVYLGVVQIPFCLMYII